MNNYKIFSGLNLRYSGIRHVWMALKDKIETGFELTCYLTPFENPSIIFLGGSVTKKVDRTSGFLHETHRF
jgi:hypothetical protein